MIKQAQINESKFIGNGRSAKVFLSEIDGKTVAKKIFTGEPVSKFILFVLTGSANPYTWCEAAIQSAMTRRRVLSNLCQLWFGDQLRLPETHSYKWNVEQMAFEINAEFINGRHAPLFSPLTPDAKDFMKELKQEVMEPLREKLIESGFDGLVWQAGKGNPVGASNFMVKQHNNGTHQWIWIDLESGLPALFALNPLSTLFYYLPMCIKHRGWLFDHVDTAKLSNYVEQHKDRIIESLGAETWQAMRSDIESLTKTQSQWTSLSRHRKSLYYAASQGKVSPEEKAYYENRAFRWFLKSIFIFMSAFSVKIVEFFRNLKDTVLDFPYRKFFRRIRFYIAGNRYRWGVARWYLKKEIKKWQSRKFLNAEETSFLKNELKNTESSAYLTDFSIHIALKPLVKIFAWGIFPLLIATQVFSLKTGAFLIVLAGPFARTSYTTWRISNSLVQSRPYIPWLAMLLGVLPAIGNLAYPAELLYRSTGKKDRLAKFIAYSFSAKIGARVPVWGGQDTETEHFFNRICHKLLKP